MAFFDDLNRKISKAGQKAKDFSDSSRINSLINEEEKKINNYYNQIGKLYVSLHANDCEPDFEGFMSYVAESEAKLKDLRAQLQLLKGVKKCPQCGDNVALDAAFCPMCGFRMPKEESESNLVRCASCNQFVAKNLRFCTYCGKPMNVVPVVEQPPVIQEQTPQVETTVNTQPPVSPQPVQQPVVPPMPEQAPVQPENGLNIDATRIIPPFSAAEPDEQPAPPAAEPEQPVVAPQPDEQPAAPAFARSAVTPVFAQPAVPQTDNVFCAMCGFSLPSDSAFCPECGHKVD